MEDYTSIHKIGSRTLNFVQNFPDETSCKQHVRELREKYGVFCPKCGGTNHYWKSDIKCFECKKCKHPTGLRNGTVMHATKMPFRKRYADMHLLTVTRKSF